MYVYKRSEPQLWTVGFYSPDGKWNPESDHNTTEQAAKRVAYLNGGSQFSDEDIVTLKYMAEIHRKTSI